MLPNINNSSVIFGSFSKSKPNSFIADKKNLVKVINDGDLLSSLLARKF